METRYMQYEVLIATDSNFFNRQWQEKEAGKNDLISRKIKLVEACWNGLLPALLPECSERLMSDDMVLWEVKEGSNFISLEYANSYPVFNYEQSLNPYLFLQLPTCN